MKPVGCSSSDFSSTMLVDRKLKTESKEKFVMGADGIPTVLAARLGENARVSEAQLKRKTMLTSRGKPHR